jgi:energy-converting hydrogenase Eha subunit H
MRNIRNVNTAGYRFLAVVALLISLPGCRVAGDIFKAGMWVAVIGIAIVVALGYGIVSLLRR